jgi:hypothetical protein
VWGVLAVSAEAAAGVRVGMTLAQAESCCPDLVRRPYDAVYLAQEHERLLAALEAHVAVAPGALGWALFRPPWPSAEERRALAWLLDALAATTGYLAVVRVTEGRGAAEIVARAAVGARLRAVAGRPSGSPPPWAGTADPLGTPNAVAWVAPGGAATALAPLPAALLPVSAAMRRRLTLFGLPTNGALAALPLGAVQAQFGPEGRLAWLIAHGRDPRPLMPREPPGVPSAAVALDAPCTERARLLALAEVLLARALRAVPAGQGVSSIRLVAEIESSPGAPATWERRVVLGEPTAAAAAAIRFALAGTLLRATPPGPIVGLRLELHDLGARCHEGALERYGHVDGEVGERLRYELDLIRQHGLAGYFLIVWDLMAFARRERIPAQGRGSAANSIVAYVLGLTNVDPLRHKLFVGRFLNEELATLPDIDIDFSREHRERVLQYV